MTYTIRTRLKTFVKNIAIGLIDWYLLVLSKPLKPTSKSAIIFAPHQDDESFGCGGLIALKRAEGALIRVVFLTDGGKSDGWDRMPAGALVKQRQQEVLKALELLGLHSQSVTFLNQPDGELDQLSDEDRHNLVKDLANLLSEIQPEEVYVTYHRDGHGDHVAASQLVKSAIQQVGLRVRLMEYPIWSLYQPFQLNFRKSEFAELYRLDIQTVRSQKLQAIACHGSQHGDSGLPHGFVERLSSRYEFFFSTLLEK